MVYNWDGKEAECYRLYVEEKKSLDEVMEYWEQRGFTPSKRAFQTQFKRWEFPRKQNPAHKNPALIARVKELWETNTMQKDMLDLLQAEGFQINDRELLRVRLRFNWLLRESRGRGFKRKVSGDGSGSAKKTRKEKVVHGSGLINQLGNAILQQDSESEEDESSDEQEAGPEQGLEDGSAQTNIEPEPLAPEEALRRQIRQEQLHLESAEKWRARKRRRRTRGWAGLPADAPGQPPRFPSETTLDESKAYLGLDNPLYRQVREQFHTICEEESVVKKTLAGPEKWAQLKHRLIQENEHLSNVFQHDEEARQQIGTMPTPSNFKALSIDVICTDVTKRLRTMGTRMGLPEAKTALGLNPEEARLTRSAFLAILEADHFTNKYEAGDEHWNELKEAWIKSSDLLSRVLAQGATDPKHKDKEKAIEVLARDVMKRFRADEVQKDPSRKKQVNQGPGPGPAPPSITPHTSKVARKDSQAQRTPRTNNTSQGPMDLLSLSSSSDFQIDPSLLLAASDPSMIPEPPHSHSHSHTPSQSQPQSQAQHTSYVQIPQFFNSLPLPIYFRLHPHSHTSMPNKTVWLGILQSGTVAEIRNLAMREHPGTGIVRIEGLVMHRGGGQSDREVAFAIDDEDELAAYLEHVAGGKATFVVLLAPGGQVQVQVHNAGTPFL